MSSTLSRNLVASSVCAAIGAAFVYYAGKVLNGDASVISWRLDCGFSFLAIAVSAGRLFEKIELVHGKVVWPRVTELLAVPLIFAGVLCFIFAFSRACP